MGWLKDYNSLPNFLTRKTILNVSKVHIRTHDILSEDKTPFLHNHPFYYLSIILKGGYTEELLKDGQIVKKKHKRGSFIWRRPKDFHRIKSIDGITKTLFFTWKVDMKWSLKKHEEITYDGFTFPEKDGIYFRIIKGKKLYCKFEGFWYIGNETLCGALKETRVSIHQMLEYSKL